MCGYVHSSTLCAQLQRLEPGGVHALFNNAGTNYSEDFESYPVKVGGWSIRHGMVVGGCGLDHARRPAVLGAWGFGPNANDTYTDPHVKRSG